MVENFAVVARHGRTCPPGEKSVFLGSAEDVELTEHGRQDARELGRGLSRLKRTFRQIRHSGLRRTHQTALGATQTCPELALSPMLIDRRLVEIDYGRWTGRTAEELADSSEAEDLRLWQQKGQFPADGHFSPDLNEVLGAWNSLFTELGEHPRATGPAPVDLLVAHAGCLRILAASLGHPSAKMACGHFGIVAFTATNRRIMAWNVDPAADLQTLEALLACDRPN